MEIPCYKQKKNYTCAVCCLKMVLEYYGKEYEEIELEKMCRTTERGTIAKNVVDTAKRIGFWAAICEGDLEFIRACIHKRDNKLILRSFLARPKCISS